MSKSKIEWTTRTWNPVTGCTKVSQGCKFCYAETMYERFHGKGSFKNVICHEDRLLQPLSWKGKEMCFVNSMSDLFHEDVPFEFIDNVFAIMAMAEDINFQILTKRPQRMYDYFRRVDISYLTAKCFLLGDYYKHISSQANKGAMRIITSWPLSNVWLGVSVEDQQAANERIPWLIRTPADIRFLSCEPLLGPVDITNKGINNGYSVPTRFINAVPSEWTDPGAGFIGVDWVIVGGESGPKARPMDPNWARSLRDQCKEAGTKFFFKQWGNYKYEGDQPVRCTKRDAGRLLDDVLHDEYPINH